MTVANKFYLIIASAFILHLLCINFYPVNFEHSFAEASHFIGIYDEKILQFYFDHQANTVIFSLLSGIVNKIFFFLDSFQVAKLISSSGYIFLGIGLFKFNKIYPIPISVNFLILITFLNPLLWTYGYRGTPDFFSLAICFFSFSIVISYKNLLLKMFGALLLGFSMIIKPMTGIFLIPCIFYVFFENNYYSNFFSKIKKITLIFGTFIIIPLLYSFVMWFNFDFILLPPNEQIRGNWLVLNINFFMNNFLLYCAFSFLFLFPFSVFYLFKIFFNSNRNLKYFLIILSLFIFFLGYFFINRIEEMGFGPFDKLFSQKIKNGIFGLSAAYFIFISIKIFKTENKSILLLTIYLYFFIMSFSLPAQRYIIIILPLIIILFSSAFDNRSINASAFLLYIVINILLLLNHYNNGVAANKMLNYLKDKDILDQTCPGVIESHVGNHFQILNKNCNRRYHVVEGIQSDTFFIVTQKVFPGKIIVFSVHGKASG